MKRIKFSNELQGILFMLGSCLAYAILNCISKNLSSTMHPLTMVFYRNTLGLILMIPFVLNNFSEISNFKSFTKINLIRGVLAYVSVACWYFAIFNLPITEVISLSFLTPILTSIFAIILLKERLGFEKLIALLVGFTGTYIMLQPEIKGFNFYILYALAACTIWAISNIIVKNLTATQNPKIIVLNLAIVLMPISLPGFLLNFQIPSLVELGMIVLIAIFSNLAQVFMTTAYQKTRVTVVVPFDFMKLVFTSIIAYLMLGELIEYQTLIGSALILFASYIVIKKEAGKRKK